LGKVKPEEVRPLSEQIAEEFPSGEERMNRELIRLAAYLDSESLSNRALEYLEGDAPMQERLHVAMYLRFLNTAWTPEQQFKLLRFYEQAALEEAGSSVPLYVMNATRDFGRRVLNERDARTILSQGTTWPNAALAALYKIPQPVDIETARLLQNLDLQISASEEATSDVYRRLRTGIVAMLSAAGDEESLAYLRRIWREDPERRQAVAMGLSMYPEGDNWDYLVRSLNILEGPAASQVMVQLASVKVATDDPEAIRQVILQGLRTAEDGGSADPAMTLLQHWTGARSESGKAPTMSAWQKWYAKTFPDRPAAEIPEGDSDSRWDFEQLATYIGSENGRYGDPQQGKLMYQSASCAACHRFGNEGSSVGPDLSNIAKRFTKREVLESVLFPSHVISDQYMNRRVLTLDGRVYIGLVAEDATTRQLSIRNSNNDVTMVKTDDVDQILPSTSSIMPGNLLDDLSLKEISDLLAYLKVLPALEIATKP
jgi:putative heme-binding domain-containing protein